MSDQTMLPLFEPDELDERAQALRSSAAPDLYNPSTYIAWPFIEQRLVELQPGIEVLESLAQSHPLEAEDLAAALRATPAVLDVARTLLVSASSVGFADGREIPRVVPVGKPRRLALAHLLLEVGLNRIIGPNASLNETTTVGLIALDTRRRGFRRRDAIRENVEAILNDALNDASELINTPLKKIRPSGPSSSALSRADFVIGDGNGRPVAAIVTGIYTQSGGRQQSDLAYRYPSLQATLDDFDIALIAIVDGQYIRDAPLGVLRAFVKGVPFAMTVRQAQDGELAKAIANSPSRQKQEKDHPALDPLISATLRAGRIVNADDLPISRAEARLALSTYVAQRPEEALQLDPSGTVLSSSHSDWRHRAYVLLEKFDQQNALELFVDMLGGQIVRDVQVPTSASFATVLSALPEDRILPNPIFLAATRDQVGQDAFKQVVRMARSCTANASIAGILTAEPTTHTSIDQAIQRTLATSVIVIRPSNLQAMAAAANPRDIFVQLVLQQADLTKANPFNATGTTHRRMYFGRDEELATLLSALDTSSVSLLGGRRIGKTSFLQRSVDGLVANGWKAVYADCQAVGDWQSFASHIRSRWSVELPEEFSASNLQLLADQLVVENHGDRLVIALDEIDYLLRWDQEPHSGQVAEAFFRACRTISQAGQVRFIFSGERLIAQKMWDPSSPHYNFCRPLPIRQLARRASEDLLMQPLLAMGISVEDVEVTGELSWRYTSGHPHLVQYLGEGIVGEINRQHPDERDIMSSSTVSKIAETTDFMQHYVETYWGQATDLERLLSLLIAQGYDKPQTIRRQLATYDLNYEVATLNDSLRMLELYGVLESLELPLKFRAVWFPTASQILGSTEVAISDLKGRLVS